MGLVSELGLDMGINCNEGRILSILDDCSFRKIPFLFLFIRLRWKGRRCDGDFHFSMFLEPRKLVWQTKFNSFGSFFESYGLKQPGNQPVGHLVFGLFKYVKSFTMRIRNFLFSFRLLIAWYVFQTTSAMDSTLKGGQKDFELCVIKKEP